MDLQLDPSLLRAMRSRLVQQVEIPRDQPDYGNSIPKEFRDAEQPSPTALPPDMRGDWETGLQYFLRTMPHALRMLDQGQGVRPTFSNPYVDDMRRLPQLYSPESTII
jgi:hypothetical protein